MTRVDVHEITEDRPDLVDALAAVRAETDREVNPHDPPPPPAELAGDLFPRMENVYRRGWLAYLDEHPVGEATVAFETDDDNRHVAQVEWLAVCPTERRKGVADALLGVVLPALVADGRTSLLTWVPDLPSGDGIRYAERLGLTKRTEERCSRLVVGAHDTDLIEGWIVEGRTRTDGYQLVQYVGPCPDDHLDALVEAHRAMEDMPTDEMEWTIPTMSPGLLRSREGAMAAGGKRLVTTLVVTPDGRGAGLSELVLNAHRPQLAWQGDTGVRAEHRGHGLGRWLKAENLRLALETEPSIGVVETYNASTNPWMLDINVAMGFRPHVGYQAWQGDLARALARVGASR